MNVNNNKTKDPQLNIDQNSLANSKLAVSEIEEFGFMKKITGKVKETFESIKDSITSIKDSIIRNRISENTVNKPSEIQNPENKNNKWKKVAIVGALGLGIVVTSILAFAKGSKKIEINLNNSPANNAIIPIVNKFIPILTTGTPLVSTVESFLPNVPSSNIIIPILNELTPILTTVTPLVSAEVKSFPPITSTLLLSGGILALPFSIYSFFKNKITDSGKEQTNFIAKNKIEKSNKSIEEEE